MFHKHKWRGEATEEAVVTGKEGVVVGEWCGGLHDGLREDDYGCGAAEGRDGGVRVQDGGGTAAVWVASTAGMHGDGDRGEEL
ncbi:hypothetical protein SESBI_40419 [Sesbania bispinosa]|nr:hypothetical protein SESBI_40419 [Sesbania bispinosa]